MKLTLLSCLAAFALVADAEYVNVLSLGVRNDGSADVSAIVNAATEKSSLFFPAGRYRVAHPLVLRHPIRGEGYARKPSQDNARTWFVSALNATNATAGIVSFGGNVQVNVEEVNFLCSGQECAIRIEPCQQNTYTFISRVGIFDLCGTGVHIRGEGSRPIFVQDVTVWGKAFAEHSLGLNVDGPADCRLMNIEVMGTRIGLRVRNGHTYGCNLHLWTGSMAGTDNGTWWKGTRGIVLGPSARFAGSQIYPDTSYCAVEQVGDGGMCEISNVMYWEDSSIKVAKDHDGRFYRQTSGKDGRIVLQGGTVGVGGTDDKPGWMARMYDPRIVTRDVAIKSLYAIVPKNLDRLCLGGTLPDYSVSYAEKGWCKVADIFADAPAGCCQAEISRDDGAAWKITVRKTTKSPKVTVDIQPLDADADPTDIRSVEKDGMVRLYLRNTAATPLKARFATLRMGERFRPVDHGMLRDYAGKVRYREVLP